MTCFYYNGQTLWNYCKDKGYSYITIYRVLDEKGMSVDDAIEHYLTHRGRCDNKTQYFYKGEKLTSFCHRKGISYNTIHNRIKFRNMSVEQAVETKKNKRNEK